MEIIVPLEAYGERLDKFLASRLTLCSRARIQAGIEKGEILLKAERVSQKLKLKGGECLSIDLRDEPVIVDQPEAIPLRIVYEDESILVINKQAGLTVHPGAGQLKGTLMNALLYHDSLLSRLPRAGIVHRLDKNTSGLMVVAKTEEARLKLIAALKKHELGRTYIALLEGELLSGCTVDAPIGRHPIDRKKMAVLLNSSTAKEAVTHIKILQKFKGFTLVQAKLETGRTHQIRVHMANLGYPLVGDKIYGSKQPAFSFQRQALQAIKLELTHPQNNEPMVFEIEAECDIANLLKLI